MSKMHGRDGFCFERLPEGTVRVSKVLYGPNPAGPHKAGIEAVAYSADLPANEWASIVAHVSQHGDNGESWRQALDFHGEPPA